MFADRTIEVDLPPSGDFINVDDWTVHYVQEGSGPDIVLIHGAGGSTQDMTFNLLPKLAETFRVTAIDRPAHGWTTGPKESETITPHDQAELMLRVIEALGLDKPLALGQSYGGSVALAMALQNEDAMSGLCLLSAAITDAIPSGAQSLEMLTRLQTVRAATLATISSPRFIELALAKLFSPQDVPEGYQEHLGVRAAYRERTFRAHMLQASGLSDSLRKMMPHYDGIKLPVEIIHGSDDTIIKCDEHAVWASERLPNAKLTVLPGIGHMPHHTSVDEVADRVIRMSRG